MHFLALDIGSSSIKGAVLDSEKLTIEHTHWVPFPESSWKVPAGRVEVNPQKIIGKVKGVLSSLLNQATECAGILFSCQMGGLILEEDGKIASNYISWQDQRTTEPHPSGEGSYLEIATKRIGKENLQAIGGEFRAGAMMPLLFWMEERGELPARAVPLTLGAFLYSHLFKSSYHLEPTLSLGMVDLRSSNTLKTPHGALECLGINRVLFPPWKTVWEPVGFLSFDGRQIPCYPAIGDHQAALTGAMLDLGELSLNISTGSQISLLTENLWIGKYQTRPYFDGRYLNTITHLPAGRSLNVLVALLSRLGEDQRAHDLKQVTDKFLAMLEARGRSEGAKDIESEGIEFSGDNYKPFDPWLEIAYAARKANDTDLSVNLTFFEGPLGSRGSISNITTENLSVGTLFRAAFRNMAENYATCAARLSPERNWDRIVFSGGLAQKLPLLRQFILEKLPGESRLCSSAEDTLLGLLVISQVISGRAKDLQAASRLVSAAQGG